MIRKANWIWVAMFATLIFSCGKAEFYEQSEEIPNGEWHQAFVVSFEVDIKDTEAGYDIYLDYRNTDSYPYNNIWIYLETMYEGKLARVDTIPYVMQGPDGKWLGNHSGSMIDNHVKINDKEIRFRKAGKYKFKIRHAMRDEPLYGITDVGLTLSKK